jgi:protein gp37
MSDLFHEKMPFNYLDNLFKVISLTPYHTYQILTKREQILDKYFRNKVVPDNVWIGVTVENKKYKNRIDVLRNINATIRFLSLEPLLEDLGEINLSKIHWVIVGGESGPKARPMKKEWVISLQKQCEDQKVAFFFKQWGTWGVDGVKRNKKQNGRILMGKEWSEQPQVVQL